MAHIWPYMVHIWPSMAKAKPTCGEGFGRHAGNPWIMKLGLRRSFHMIPIYTPYGEYMVHTCWYMSHGKNSGTRFYKGPVVVATPII